MSSLYHIGIRHAAYCSMQCMHASAYAYCIYIANDIKDQSINQHRQSNKNAGISKLSGRFRYPWQNAKSQLKTMQMRRTSRLGYRVITPSFSSDAIPESRSPSGEDVDTGRSRAHNVLIENKPHKLSLGYPVGRPIGLYDFFFLRGRNVLGVSLLGY